MWSRICADVADEVEVAAAGVGHALEQRLVEVGADAEGARGDAAVAQLAREPLELRVVDDPDVGEAVGEQQDAVDAVGGEAARDLLAAGQPAAVEVRAAAGVDVPEPVGGTGPLRRRGDASTG